MAYIPGSSFIPKETMNATPKVAQRKRAFSVMGFLASTLLVISILGAIGVVAYKAYLEKQLAEVKEALVNAEKEDLTSKMKEIAIFDRQLSTAKQLLDNHIAPSRIFAELEKMTKVTVGYDELEYKYTPGSFAELNITGGTNELTSVALQKIEFAAQSLFTSFTIEDITLGLDVPGGSEERATADDEGTDPVGFKIIGSLNTEALKYDGNIPVPAPITSISESVEEVELSGETLIESIQL